jgi:hypothetical protein
MTGTNGIATSPAGGGVGDELGGALEGGASLDGGVGLAPSVGALEGEAVGGTVTPVVPLGVGSASDPPGGEVGGVEESHAARRSAVTAARTSRVLTDRLITEDLTD